MEETCKICGGVLKEKVKKCTTCSEFRGIRGWLLRYLPIASIIIGAGSFVIAIYEIDAREMAVVREKIAEKDRLVITRELHAKDRAAERAMHEITKALPEKTKTNIITGLRLQPRISVGQLEKEAKASPEDSELQRKLYLFRALERPG